MEPILSGRSPVLPASRLHLDVGLGLRGRLVHVVVPLQLDDLVLTLLVRVLDVSMEDLACRVWRRCSQWG